MSALTASCPPAAALLLGLGAASALLAANVLRPPRWPSFLAIAAFFAGWLSDELVVQQLVLGGITAGALIYAGGLAAPEGWAGLVLLGCSWVGFGVALRRSRGARATCDAALALALGRPDGAPGAGDATASQKQLAWRRILRVFPIRLPDVVVERDVVFSEPGERPLKLDVYRHRSRSLRAPTLVFVHGGGWVSGDKERQGLLTANHLASRGWVVLNISYRLSPRATFPEPVIDVKRAIAWARSAGVEYGCDPEFIALAGGSAGAHLASLAALTANDPAYQPGFEAADTRVQACVPFYGIYDFTDGFGHWPHRAFHPLLERLVMKRARLADPGAFLRASPVHQVGPEAPPFFVIHGDRDTLAPVEEAREFVRALRAASRQPVAYAELRGAQHAFELFPSIRSTIAIEAVGEFLEEILRRQRDSAQR
jgi:acetyl esterase/lipase